MAKRSPESAGHIQDLRLRTRQDWIRLVGYGCTAWSWCNLYPNHTGECSVYRKAGEDTQRWWPEAHLARTTVL